MCGGFLFLARRASRSENLDLDLVKISRTMPLSFPLQRTRLLPPHPRSRRAPSMRERAEPDAAVAGSCI